MSSGITQTSEILALVAVVLKTIAATNNPALVQLGYDLIGSTGDACLALEQNMPNPVDLSAPQVG